MPAGRDGMQLLKQGVRDGLDNRHTGYLPNPSWTLCTYLLRFLLRYFSPILCHYVPYQPFYYHVIKLSQDLTYYV